MKRQDSAMPEIDLEKLYERCEPFNEYDTRMDDPTYAAALKRYLSSLRILEDQMNEEQAERLHACIQNAKVCMSFEILHYLRQGFLLGISARLKT